MGLFRRDHSDWVDGTASVLDVEQTGTYKTNNFGQPTHRRAKLKLQVSLPGGVPYEARTSGFLRMGVAQTLRGRNIAVKADPEKPGRLAIDWNTVGTGGSGFPIQLGTTELVGFGGSVGADPQAILGQLAGIGISFSGTGSPVIVTEATTDVTNLDAQQALRANGIEGTAIVHGITDTGVSLGDSAVITMDLHVTVSGREPYDVRHATMVPRARLTSVTIGSALRVHVNQDQPKNLAIDW
jgi:hypothetical protein